MSMTTKIGTFFGPSRQYAVAGASNSPHKFGYKIFDWYLARDLKAIPVNPREKEIIGQPVVHNIETILNTLKAKEDLDIYQLSAKDGLSISFLTPPEITLATLGEIASGEGYQDLVKGLWFQPGSYSERVIQKASDLGLLNKTVYQDECILIRGDEGLLSVSPNL